jgi:enoyl-CoA hydratase/carnithine racemase
VRNVRLARPAKMNAIDEPMYAALAGALETAEADPALRAVLLCAEGSDFCAGNDLAGFAALAAAGPEAMRNSQVLRFLRALAAFHKPLLAAAQGRAIGVGATLLLHCDLIYAASDLELRMPFVDLALVPEAASSLLLPARIGHARAYGVFALGETIEAAEALRLGLVNAVCAAPEHLAKAQSAAQALSAKAPGALSATKRLMREHAPLVAVMEREAEVFGARLSTPEAMEAFQAFLQKRPPRF